MMTNKKKVQTIDKHIGLRLKMRRIIIKMTQEQLAEKLGISFQQLQKYEKAINRISASTLYDIAEILETDISYFFDGFNRDMIIKEDIFNFAIHA